MTIYKTILAHTNENGKYVKGNNTKRRAEYDSDTNRFRIVIALPGDDLVEGQWYDMPSIPHKDYNDYDQLLGYQTAQLVCIAETGDWGGKRAQYMRNGWTTGTSRGGLHAVKARALKELYGIESETLNLAEIEALHAADLQRIAAHKAAIIAKGKATKLANKLALEAGLPIVKKSKSKVKA